MSITENPRMRLIAGPCLMESREHAMGMAYSLADIAKRYPVDFIFKASFDKANRTKGDSPRQKLAEWAADDVFGDIRNCFGVETITDIHEWNQPHLLKKCSWYQVPALLSRQTDLIKSCAQLASSGIVIKKGQFMAPQDVRHAVDKARAVGSGRVIVAERGYTFGYNNLVVDMRAFPIMKATSGADEIIFDATHSVQLPSSNDGVSGGDRDFIEPLARAAIAAGADGIFCEVHDDPRNALSDAAIQIPLHRFEPFLANLVDLYQWAKGRPLSSFQHA